MKRNLPLTLTLVFVFMFVFSMTLQVLALNEPENPEDPLDPITGGGIICCTITNSCGGIGYGSYVPYTCYDQLGKPHTCYRCTYLWPGQPYYNFKCRYQPPPSCNQQ
ncbi:MAG: hypothetical protein KKA42_12985 [candidate division Zixibacteria bacterium]|nr:hypothetical protein [candidate division Zixibacteria bacterium]